MFLHLARMYVSPAQLIYCSVLPTTRVTNRKRYLHKLLLKIHWRGDPFVLKIGLGILEVRVKEEAEVREQGYAKGHRKGYAEAERLFKVTYPCSVCRETLTVTSRDEKEAIRQYMQEHRWGHIACFENKGGNPGRRLLELESWLKPIWNPTR